MGEVQGQGYIAQALGIADVLAVAYFHALTYRPDDPEWEGRDRFLLSIGHYAIALYAALIEARIIPEDELESYGSDDSRLPMSSMASYTPGMEISGGSLGHGLGIAVGMALALKRKKSKSFVYNLLSDGELDEGSTWEAAMSAGSYKLDNLIAIVDVNNQQADGPSTEDPQLRAAGAEVRGLRLVRRNASTATTSRRWSAAFDKARGLTEPKPRVVICDTRMAQGHSLPGGAREEPFPARRTGRMAEGARRYWMRGGANETLEIYAPDTAHRAGRGRPEGRLAPDHLGHDRLARRPPASAPAPPPSATRWPSWPRRGPTSSA